MKKLITTLAIMMIASAFVSAQDLQYGFYKDSIATSMLNEDLTHVAETSDGFIATGSYSYGFFEKTANGWQSFPKNIYDMEDIASLDSGMYVASNDYRVYAFDSLNIKLLATFPKFIYDMKVYGDTIMVGHEDGFVSVSYDAGTNWKTVDLELPLIGTSYPDIYAVAILNGDFVAIDSRGIIHHSSTNADTAWTIENPGLSRIYSSASLKAHKNGFGVLTTGYYIYRIDGASWQQVFKANTYLQDVVIVNSQIMYAVGTNVIVFTRDGGKTWTQYANMPYAFSSVAYNQNLDQICAVGKYGAVVLLDNVTQNQAPKIVGSLENTHVAVGVEKSWNIERLFRDVDGDFLQYQLKVPVTGVSVRGNTLTAQFDSAGTYPLTIVAFDGTAETEYSDTLFAENTNWISVPVVQVPFGRSFELPVNLSTIEPVNFANVKINFKRSVLRIDSMYVDALPNGMEFYANPDSGVCLLLSPNAPIDSITTITLVCTALGDVDDSTSVSVDESSVFVSGTDAVTVLFDHGGVKVVPDTHKLTIQTTYAGSDFMDEVIFKVTDYYGVQTKKPFLGLAIFDSVARGNVDIIVDPSLNAASTITYNDLLMFKLYLLGKLQLPYVPAADITKDGVANILDFAQLVYFYLKDSTRAGNTGAVVVEPESRKIYLTRDTEIGFNFYVLGDIDASGPYQPSSPKANSGFLAKANNNTLFIPNDGSIVVELELNGSVESSNGDLFVVDLPTGIQRALIIDVSGDDIEIEFSGNTEIISAKANGSNLSITSVGDAESSAMPDEFKLEQNYPNPFNPTTNIRYSIFETNTVKITIFDIMGRVIKELVNEVKDAGTYTVTWNGRDNAGQMATSGLYLYRIEAGTFTDVKRMMLMK